MTIIYHNPRCTKSRLTLELLEKKGIKPTVVEYLRNTPDFDALKNIFKMLGVGPRDIIRKGEEVYKTNGANDESLSDDDLIKIMVANPELIERPIVVANGKAAIGRPPENVLAII